MDLSNLISITIIAKILEKFQKDQVNVNTCMICLFKYQRMCNMYYNLKKRIIVII